MQSKKHKRQPETCSSGSESESAESSGLTDQQSDSEYKIDDKEKDDQDDQDVETVIKDCEVGYKLSDIHRVSIRQMENVLTEPSGTGPGGGAGVGSGYVKSIDEKCTHNVNIAKEGELGCSSKIDVSSGDTNTTVTCVQFDADVSDVSEAKLVIDESATGEGVSVEDGNDSSSDFAICHGSEVPLSDQEGFQCTPPCSQMPQVNPFTKLQEREKKHSQNR